MHGTVVRREELTPSLVRIVLGGEGLSGFEAPVETDAYVNLAIAPDGAAYGPVFDPAEVRESQPKDMQPARRRYTVRRWDAESGELTLDFVVHGDVGAAGRWAASAEVGDVLVLEGPGAGYRPDSSAAWHLMVGDESALPAIAASLEVLDPSATAVVRLECDGPDHQVPLLSPARLDLAWVHRTAEDPAPLPAAIEALDFPEGRVHAFVHGEADEIRAIRRHLLVERGLTRQDTGGAP